MGSENRPDHGQVMGAWPEEAILENYTDRM